MHGENYLGKMFKSQHELHVHRGLRSQRGRPQMPFLFMEHFSKVNLTPIDTKDASFKNAKPYDVKKHKA